MIDTRNDGRRTGHISDHNKVTDLDGRVYLMPIEEIDGFEDEARVTFLPAKRHGRWYATRVLDAL